MKIEKTDVETKSEGKELWNDMKKSLIEVTGIEKLCLGNYYSLAFKLDIKHLMFSFARYKFISKLFRFEQECDILELGCSEGMGALFFTQLNNSITYKGVDFDDASIDWAQLNLSEERCSFVCDDFLNKSFGSFDGVISVDVIEHIKKSNEKEFLDTVCCNLKENGTAVIGTPNITMDPYASPGSKQGHVNLFSQAKLYQLCKERFHNVFIFNMNDEIVHTGMDPMSCYIFAVCCGKK